jgi:hypothetical protein
MKRKRFKNRKCLIFNNLKWLRCARNASKSWIWLKRETRSQKCIITSCRF